MFPEGEAQKVIAISLGKIAISRNQRGGPKLFKNLLVANVIQKARYVVLDETAQLYRSRYEQPNNDVRTEVAYSSGFNCDSSTDQEVSLNSDSVGNLATNEFHRPASSRDDDSAGTLVSSDGMDVADDCDFWDEQNKENVLPKQENASQMCNRNVFAGEKLYYSSTVSLPSRCVKRRSSTSEDLTTVQLSTKKARRDCKSSHHNWRKDDFDIDSDSEELGLTQSNDSFSDVIGDVSGDDQMDLEQISSLVSVFSSSFKGLVDNPTSTTGNELTFFYGDKSSLRRGASLPDVGGTVCSKQAGSVFTMRQSSFETSTPPIVALTV